MSEAAPEQPAPPAQEAPKGDTPPASTPDETDWKVEARKWEQRAKENGAKAKEFEKQQQAAMTDAERAVSEAETRGRTAAAAEFGTRLARTEFDALAGRRNPEFKTAEVMDFIDLSKFVGDDGEPNAKAIAAAVERLVPPAQTGPPSYDGGTRTPPAAQQGMSDLIRKAAGRA